MDQKDPTFELLTLKDAASLSPYSADYLNLLCRKGKIHGMKVGRDWLIRRSDLFEYLEKQRQANKSRLAELSRYIGLFM